MMFAYEIGCAFSDGGFGMGDFGGELFTGF